MAAGVGDWAAEDGLGLRRRRWGRRGGAWLGRGIGSGGRGRNRGTGSLQGGRIASRFWNVAGGRVPSYQHRALLPHVPTQRAIGAEFAQAKQQLGARLVEIGGVVLQVPALASLQVVPL